VSSDAEAIVDFLWGSGILAHMLRREKVGIRRVYHCTNHRAAAQIRAQGVFRPGISGLFGAGIYFAESEASARSKAAHDGSGDDAIIEVNVDFGWAAVYEGRQSQLTAADISAQGCQSVKGRRSIGAAWEYVVFDSSQIEILRTTGQPSEVRTGPEFTREDIGRIYCLLTQRLMDMDDRRLK
jgi:hypothetical protein